MVDLAMGKSHLEKSIGFFITFFSQTLSVLNICLLKVCIITNKESKKERKKKCKKLLKGRTYTNNCPNKCILNNLNKFIL